MKKYLQTIVVLCISLLLITLSAKAQQVIGVYPEMDGGLEGQPAETLAVGSISTNVQKAVWSSNYAGMGRIISSDTARTGAKYAYFNAWYPGGTNSGRLQTPTTAAGAIPFTTLHTVQFYYRTKDTTSPGPNTQMRMAISADATTNLNIYKFITLPGTNKGWQLFQDTVNSSTSGTAGRYGVAALSSRQAAMLAPMDVDDFVIYPGLPDLTAPDAPTSPLIGSKTSSQISINWTAPSTGIDSGGYIVIRKVGSSPTSTPNQRGIYAIGNTLTAGEAVVYLGKTPSFTDYGLSATTHYYYKIFSLDKAFNYSSSSIEIDATTDAPTFDVEPTVQASNIGLTPGSSSMNITWINGNGTNHLVVIHAGTAINADPVDGASYAANSVFGSGSQIGTGNYIIYNGTGNTASVSGLSKMSVYYISVYEFNGTSGHENYLVTNPATSNGTTLPGNVVSAASGDYATGATWVGGVVPTAQDNVVIATGHTVMISATQDAHNLTVANGATLLSGLNLPISGDLIKYIRINGDSLVTNGTLGGSANAIGIECRANVIMTGTGTLRPCRLRPGSNVSNIAMIIDQNMILTYTGSTGTAGTAIYTENGTNDNITITINFGKTVTFVDNANFYMNNTNSNGLASTVINVNGTLDLSGANSNLGIKTSTGKSCVLNVNGSLIVGRNFNATSAAGGGVSTITVGNAGVLTVNGTADFTEPTVVATGAGTFTLGSAATLNIGSADGISASGATGNIQTAIRNFSTNGMYHYVGVAHQNTGDGLPSTIGSLTISNNLGVALTHNVTIADTLHLSTGDLDFNGNVITLGPNGYLREPSGNTLIGASGYITTTRTLSITDTTEIAGLGITLRPAVNLGSTVIVRGQAVQSGNNNTSINRYFDITPTTNTGLNAVNVLRYDESELHGIIETNLRLFKSTDSGTNWVIAGGIVDTALNTITIAGVNDCSRWTAADTLNPIGGSLRSYSFNNGWNMISLPLVMLNNSKGNLFPTAASNAFTFQGGYVSKDTLTRGTGYWLKFNGSQTIGMVGFAFGGDTINLSSGWNMIGSESDTVSTSTGIEQIPPGVLNSDFFGYVNGYQSTSKLVPSKGYWIKAGTGGGKIVLHSGTTLARGNTITQSSFDQNNSITITDRNGNKQTLYVGENISDAMKSRNEMPPLPPNGIFDVRFASGRRIESVQQEKLHNQSYPILLQGVTYPITIQWNIGATATSGYSISTEGGEVIQTIEHMTGEGKYVISKQVKSLVLKISSSNNIPAEFSLGNNYPNPFNPTTQMRIGLPIDAFVDVSVFDVLGRKIQTLLNEEQPAGYHTIEWNGTIDGGNIAPSGIYFIRMMSGTFNSIQKVMLMK